MVKELGNWIELRLSLLGIAVSLSLAQTQPSAAVAAAEPPSQLQVRLDRIKAIAQPAAKSECAAQQAGANHKNSDDLFFGAFLCFAADEQVVGSFLLAAAQMRALADMSAMKPESDAAKDTASGLYFFMFYYGGGYGPDAVFREPTKAAALMRLLDDWTPQYGADYQPGWSVRDRPTAECYAEALSAAIARRRKQLAAIRITIADDKYYALQQRANDLQRRVGAFTIGSAEEVEFSELQAQMAARAKELGAEF